MGLMYGLGGALSGMRAAQSQITLVSNNLANVNTEGYTRKTAQQISNVVAGVGVGVKLGNAERNVSQSLLRSYLTASSLNGNLEKTHDYLTKVENLIGTPSDNNSIASDVARMQASFETLATDVSSSASRHSLVSDAISLTERLNNISQEIQSLRGDADLEITEICGEISGKLVAIANLNNQIVKYTALGYDGAADLMDQRDEALKEISNYIDISYYTRENGEIVIQTASGVPLLDKDPHTLSHGAISRAATDISYASGNINAISVDGVDITNSIKDGALKGLIDVRDTILPSMQTQLDELAGVIKTSLNEIHNMGTSYPGVVSTFQGTRSFIDPTTQTITIDKGDVHFVLFNQNGEQTAITSLTGDLGFKTGTINDLKTTLNGWLRQKLPHASVSIDANNRMVIDTGDSNYYLSIVETQNSTIGSEHTPVQISLDNNGDGYTDRSFSGFSSFLGLNDFFVTSASEYVYHSNAMALNSDLGIRNPISLNISTSTISGTIDLGVGDTLSSIVEKINSDLELRDHIKASLIPNGNGYMLQITNSSGGQMEINELPSGTPLKTTGFMNRIGLKVSNSNSASAIKVRDDIQVNSNILSVGSPEFDVNTGKYHLNQGNNNIINKMAEVFAKEQTFGQAGSLSKVTTSLADYASTFVGSIASQTQTLSTNKEYQEGLVSSIANRQASACGVDSDEELANLIVYQQSYAACAQVWSASRELIDLLFNAL